MSHRGTGNREQISPEERRRCAWAVLSNPETARMMTRAHLAGLTLKVEDGEKAGRERARAIRAAYAEGGWTQNDLAAAAEISQAAVSKIVNSDGKEYNEPDED
ncbi:helix-turn-helix domain-containing protein [Kitasatospora xanthocidica]|uniref:Helix-turn-helix domain-containing protein n=1 Tax=Kitasatospora xanthocidica TaxID=83382 RepID=A0A372ZVJ3_9ACTN|nr:helix-turn-helix domain-containing protein [Kitasatospora xanthocidica]RGD59452.1 helix-turn-helix domain-containing protein [Kitasatospora xanthocidica]